MKRRLKISALVLCAIMVYQICFPAAAYALTGGPSQPEVESFEPVGTSEMVDVFSGDFNYNIPLLDVDGYPINIAYHSGITMDQEASWVGLGWNLNPGVMSRNMRGIPDDFKGDLVSKIQYIKPNRTYGVSVGFGLELFGKKTDKNKAIKKFMSKIGAAATLDFGLGVNYNNYTGLGIESSISPAISSSDKFKSNFVRRLGLNARLDIASSSKDGMSIKPKVGMQPTLWSKSSFRLSNNSSVSMAVNSRSGVKSLTIASSMKASWTKTKTDANGKEQAKGGVSASISSSSNISFGTETYVPAMSQAMSNVNFSFNAKVGLELLPVNPHFSLSGYYAGQSIQNISTGSSAYGNIYAHKGNDQSLQDFNREKEGSFSEKSPVLAIPVYTYDLYQASGQGVGGMFKPYRGDIPLVHDQDISTISNGKSIAAEFAYGNLSKAGLNISFNHSEVSSGKWAAGNRLSNRIKFSETGSTPFYEPSYFKSVGEKAEVSYTNTLPYQAINKGALRPKLERTGVSGNRESVSSENTLVNVNDEEEDITSSGILKNQRDKRNTFMSYRTGAEKEFCFNKKIRYITSPATPDPSFSGYQNLTRGGGNKDNHISEISVSKNDGARYIYGIPAYNSNQYEISFTHAPDPSENEGPISPDCAKGQINYAEMTTGSPAFTNLLSPTEAQLAARPLKGIDQAYNLTHIPAYAHSYLLTDVLSADYVDVGNNGPTTDDIGSYSHFTYYRVNSSYKWRVPYKEKMANYNEGLKSDKTDDNANILYGDKEVWHLARIEGKNHYALFYISERRDGFGVEGPHGKMSLSNPSYKLDKIELFALNDPTTPVKTVHFEYDYSLCPNVENNSGEALVVNEVDLNAGKGKLTLKKIYFTYGSSTKGRFNAYTFNYSAHNPAYNLKGYDRWGNYKPNPLVEELGLNCNAAPHLLPLSNAEFPYTDQDKFPAGHLYAGKYKADVHASAWHLNQVVLPSGGIINVEYESDDYAYVQDKGATQMAKLVGFCDYTSALADPEAPVTGISYSGAMYNQTDPKECVLFKLPEELLAETDPEGLKQRLKNGLGQYLYYNCLINLTDGNDDDKHYEYVRGYTEIMDAGIINKGHGNLVGWVKVGLKAGDSQHPISRSAWQFARLYMPQFVYPGSNLMKKSDGTDVALAIVKGIVGFIPDLIEMIEGINNKLRRKNFGKDVLTDKSWIRIPSLTGRKMGGGSRVKKLWLNDQWNTNSGAGINMSYGQEYTYTTQVSINGQDKVISSGVASYEPTVGCDENVWKQPVVYDKENIGVPDDEFYTEEPFGEAYFPSPSVGYSRVEVKNLVPSDATVNAHGTGKVVHQYYTAKDFPVITSQTGLEAKSYETSALFTILGVKAEQDMTMAQGFQVELNDMHGKPKATLNYDQNNIASYSDADAFSGIQYNYEVEDEKAERKVLKTTFQVVDKANNIRTATVGLESEMVMDSRMQKSEAIAGGIQLNAELYLTPFAIASFFAWPDFSSESTTFKSSVLLRVVNRFGLVRSTVAFEEGSRVKTENVLLDAETGETLLTKTYNEYRDPVYNFTMPAHWAYDGMGPAYKNTGLRIPILPHSDALQFVAATGSNADYFSDGDVIRLEGDDMYLNKRYYVRYYDSKWYILEEGGSVATLEKVSTPKITAVILESGRKNMQSLPVMQVSSLGYPVTSDHLDFATGKEVLNASAVSYNKKWKIDPWEEERDLDSKSRMKEMIELANHLFSTGAVNNAAVRDDATEAVYHELPAGYTPSAAITGTKLATEFGSNIWYKASASSNSYTGSFSIFFSNAALTYTPNHSLTFGGFENLAAKELKLLDSDPSNDICPTQITFLAQLDNTNAFCKVTYIDDLGATKNVFTKINFEKTTFPLKCADVSGYVHNPYLDGIESAWRKQKDWVFYGRRTAASNINLRKDGSIIDFVSYWTPGSGVWAPGSDTRWTCTNEVTKYAYSGDEIENKDALGRYSAAIFSKRFKGMALAVAGNARYTDIGVENAEDPASAIVCNQKALDFNHYGNQSNEYAHTGKYSIKLTGSATRTASHMRQAEESSPDRGIAGNIMTRNDYNGFFNPAPGKYVFGAWVKVNTSNQKVASYNYGSGAAHATVIIHTGGSSSSVTMYPKGQIIEGWQRIEGEFTIVHTNDLVEFVLNGDATGSSVTFFDDIRVQPFDAKMKTYVYDLVTQLLAAELDENNYATFYEYNAEKKLVRVKKETEKGIVTLKEVRSNQRKVMTF